MLVVSGNPYDYGFMYLSEDCDKVVKALEWQLLSGRIDGRGVKQALVQLLAHKDYGIRAGTVACLQRHPNNREFAQAIFKRLEEEKGRRGAGGLGRGQHPADDGEVRGTSRRGRASLGKQCIQIPSIAIKALMTKGTR